MASTTARKPASKDKLWHDPDCLNYAFDWYNRPISLESNEEDLEFLRFLQGLRHPVSLSALMRGGENSFSCFQVRRLVMAKKIRVIKVEKDILVEEIPNANP